MLRRILAVTLALVGCSSRELPAGSELVTIQALDAEHGLGLLADPAGGLLVAKIHQDGRLVWSRPLDGAVNYAGPTVEVFGGFAALDVDGKRVDGGPSMFRVSLADGRNERWVSPGGLKAIVGVDGDERQVIALFTGAVPVLGAPRPLEIVAFDSRELGAPQWTASGTYFAPEFWLPFPWRADERHVFVPEPGIGWHVLRRDDGAEVATLAGDTDGLCKAAGRWWTSREGRLRAIDLTGGAPVVVETEADFIPPELRAQWKVAECRARGDEILFWLGIPDVWQTILAAVDARGATRWTIAVDGGPPVSRRRMVDTTAPGELVRLTEETTCRVDLDRGEVRGCFERTSTFAALAGDTSLVVGSPDGSQRVLLARLDAAGEVKAAAALTGSRQNPVLECDWLIPKADRLWLAGRAADGAGELPFVILDTRSLAPVGRTPPGITVTEARAESAEALRRVPLASLRVGSPPAPRSANPIDRRFGLQPGPVASPPPRGVPADMHPRIVDAARTAAGLGAGTAVRVLAWSSHKSKDFARIDEVLAFAEEQGTDGSPRWVLFSARAADRTLAHEGLLFRRFSHRPTNHEAYQFASVLLDVPPYEGPAAREWQVGAIDDEAWQALTGAPRSERWLRL